MFNGTPQSSGLVEHPLVPVFTNRQAGTGYSLRTVMVLQSSRYAYGAVLPQPPRLAVELVRLLPHQKKLDVCDSVRLA